MMKPMPKLERRLKDDEAQDDNYLELEGEKSVPGMNKFDFASRK